MNEAVCEQCKESFEPDDITNGLCSLCVNIEMNYQIDVIINNPEWKRKVNKHPELARDWVKACNDVLIAHEFDPEVHFCKKCQCPRSHFELWDEEDVVYWECSECKDRILVG